MDGPSITPGGPGGVDGRSGFLERLVRRVADRMAPGPRTTGRPPSANGASSFHLIWDVPPGLELVEAAVTLVVPEVPVVDRLYFWALQVSFPDGSGAHLGLQWGADPQRRMRHVNWGGYGPGGGELAGTASRLPSSFANPNTRDLDWRAGHRHRLRICRGATGWAGWVDDTLVRELDAAGGVLHAPMVWSEVFADCDHPAVSVRWCDPEVVTSSGRRLPVRAATARYQAGMDGGCDNTSSAAEAGCFVQTTSTARLTPPGARLSLD